jgi:tetratricopeptide (TPR) repeat protein
MAKKVNPPEVRIPEELSTRLVNGEINLGQFLGLSRSAQYAIAQLADNLLASGQYARAKQIFQGLVAADPFDSVFRCHLAATHQRLNEREEALAAFHEALKFNKVNVDALAGRGEVYLSLGKPAEAVRDLAQAVSLDPKGTRASTVRARAILLTLKSVAQNQ